ncbi:HNH endonuclease [Achromobacter sp. 413638]|uniref:HNH endonuclease n=1 Tax=Achromobacter sp. 413638 TaxID=3342385 RepID=UPI00370B6097
MKTLPIEYLHEALSYDPDSGLMQWKERPRQHFATDRGWRCFNSRFAGKPAGTLSPTTGYVVVNFSGGNLFGVHRLAIALATDSWPRYVDHIDRNRANNKLSNLRTCTKSENQCNRGVQRNNKCGRKGVYLHAPGKWRARVMKGGVLKDLGLFASADEAHLAYAASAQILHGEFVNLG